jgi:hypothetical protein
MSEPIKAGDRCRIINALSRNKSPNIGKEVLVGHRQYGNHGMDSCYGPIVRCTGKEVYQMDDMGAYFNAGWADIPIPWLEKIKPDPVAPEQVIREVELPHA